MEEQVMRFVSFTDTDNTQCNEQARYNTASRPQPLNLPSNDKHGEQPLLDLSAVVLAHEIGNSLHALSLSLEYVKHNLKEERTLAFCIDSAVDRAMGEVNRLCRMLRDFRSLASPQQLNCQLVSLHKIITEVLILRNIEHRAAGVEVKFEFEQSLPLVILDQDKITQVIVNLCKNAVEAMPNGGCLSITLYVAGSMIVMEFTDTGVGVPKGIDIFQPTKSTKPEGHGLGLYVSQQIVAAHEGAIVCDSEAGRGASFSVTLPLEKQQSNSP